MAINASAMKFLYIVDGRNVNWREIMVSRNTGGEVGPYSPEYTSRLRAEVVEPAKTKDYVAKGHRHRWIPSVRVIGHSSCRISVDLCFEGGFHMAGSAREGNPRFTASDPVDGEPLGLQPTDDPGQIVLAQSKAVAKLLRRQPLVVIRRRRMMELLQQRIEFSLLAWIWLEHQCHMVQQEWTLYFALVVLNLCQGVDIAFNSQ